VQQNLCEGALAAVSRIGNKGGCGAKYAGQSYTWSARWRSPCSCVALLKPPVDLSTRPWDLSATSPPHGRPQITRCFVPLDWPWSRGPCRVAKPRQPRWSAPPKETWRLGSGRSSVTAYSAKCQAHTRRSRNRVDRPEIGDPLPMLDGSATSQSEVRNFVGRPRKQRITKA